MNRQIEEAISCKDTEQVYELLTEYEKSCPEDYEIYSYWVAYYQMAEQLDLAYKWARKAVYKNPFCIESNYNYAVCAEALGRMVDAFGYYRRTLYLQQICNMEVVSQDDLLDYVAELYEELKKVSAWDEELSYWDTRYSWMVWDPFIKGKEDAIGEYIIDSRYQKYYVGYCDGWYEAYFAHGLNRDPILSKCELFPVKKIGKECEISAPGERVLVPVVLNPNLSERRPNLLSDKKKFEKKYSETAYCKYSYLPVTDKAEFITLFPAVFGRPIPLKQKKKKKSLVLNIFIDSFNAEILEKYGVSTLMPNTAGYFSGGISCRNYYTGSEYTLPSIATYWTGKYASRHMNLNGDFRWDFLQHERTFSELFHDAGYVTAKIGGNDGVIPAQDYIRGFDRFVYQYESEGMTVREVISDTLEHLDTFSDTNQFLWLEIVDLHDVAGGFMRSLSVQSKVDWETRVRDNQGANTVKQTRSHNREKIYIEELKKIDRYLHILYQYISEHYREEEVLISMFSDHGTAFLVDDDEPFVSYQRMKVPLLIKGGGSGVCEEVIETTDYAGIMCHLADVPYDYDGKDANLPVFFGGTKEKEFALSQNIFAGDPYRVGLHGKDFHWYLETELPVEKEFRIRMDKFRTWAVDEEGRDISDTLDMEKYEKFVRQQVSHLIRFEN